MSSSKISTTSKSPTAVTSPQGSYTRPPRSHGYAIEPVSSRAPSSSSPAKMTESQFLARNPVETPIVFPRSHLPRVESATTSPRGGGGGDSNGGGGGRYGTESVLLSRDERPPQITPYIDEEEDEDEEDGGDEDSEQNKPFDAAGRDSFEDDGFKQLRLEHDEPAFLPVQREGKPVAAEAVEGGNMDAGVQLAAAAAYINGKDPGLWKKRERP